MTPFGEIFAPYWSSQEENSDAAENQDVLQPLRTA
jgi:hypothetical protein